MLEAVKMALDPTPRQERMLEGNANASRFAYNLMLAHVQSQLARHENNVNWSMYAMRRWWNEWKSEIAPWWSEYSKEAYNTAFEQLSTSFKNYFNSREGKRKGKRVGFPKFRAKHRTPLRYAYTTGFALVRDNPRLLRLPRVGRVKCTENIWKRVNGAHVMRVTVSKRAGRWYAALTVEREDKPTPSTPKGGSVGVDLGVKTLATLSDGTVFDNPHLLKRADRKLRKAQKTLSRREQGSRRYGKARLRVQKVHAHVANQRRDGLNKLTTKLAHTYRDISIEDLNVSGMVKNHNLAKSISDCGFYELRRQLTYKTARTGARLHIVNRWYPSSKTCSNCGTVKAKLTLDERTYICDTCGLRIDRDLNAAINIEKYHVAPSAEETLNARGGDVRHVRRLSDAQTPVKREPSRHVNGVRLGAGSRKRVMQTRTN